MVPSIIYAYDSVGRRYKISSYSQADPTIGTDTPVNEVLYEYNDLGMVDREYQEHEGAKDANTLFVQYNYDDADGDSNGVFDNGMRLKSVRFPSQTDNYYVNDSDSTVARLTHYLYTDSKSSSPWEESGVSDAISRVSAIASTTSRGTSAENDNVYAAYLYNGVGRLAVEDFTQPDVRLDYWGQTPDTYAGFDRFGRVTQQLWRDYTEPADRAKYLYAYDRNSNRTYRDSTQATQDWAYTYDDLNRLTEARKGTFSTAPTFTTETSRQGWDLDAVGNWEGFKTDAGHSGGWDNTEARNENLANEITDIDSSSTHVGYDSRGNMTTVPDPTDMSGANLDCSYDAWNRLIEIKDGANVICKFEYDGLGRRIKKHIADGTDETYDSYRHFFYNSGWQVLETRSTATVGDDADTLEPEYQYIWSLRYIDAPVLRDENTDLNDDLCDDERLYYLTDANMNVTCLTDTGGDAVERYLYDPYGGVTFKTGGWGARGSSSYANFILYAGYYQDDETGLYHVRNRYYHALLGRFITRDPIGYVDGMSSYQYTGSRPISYVDPMGKEEEAPLTAGLTMTGTATMDLWERDKFNADDHAAHFEITVKARCVCIAGLWKGDLLHVESPDDRPESMGYWGKMDHITSPTTEESTEFADGIYGKTVTWQGHTWEGEKKIIYVTTAAVVAVFETGAAVVVAGPFGGYVAAGPAAATGVVYGEFVGGKFGADFEIKIMIKCEGPFGTMGISAFPDSWKRTYGDDELYWKEGGLQVEEE